MISPELLAVLACPNCEDRPGLEARGSALYCRGCDCFYPVVEGIPHLLPENAVPACEWKEER